MHHLVDLRPVAQYLQEMVERAQNELDYWSQDVTDEGSIATDWELEFDPDPERARDDYVQRVSEVREMLVRYRRLTREFQSGNYAGVKATLEKTLASWKMTREVLEGPAPVAVMTPDMLNRMREKNLAEQARIEQLTDLISRAM